MLVRISALATSREDYTMRILVADDAPLTVESQALLFRMAGYDLDMAFDGREALHAAEFRHPEVTFVYCTMAEWNGAKATWRNGRHSANPRNECQFSPDAGRSHGGPIPRKSLCSCVVSIF